MTTQIVAAAQLGPASAAKAETVARIARLIEQAGSEGVTLVVFPELALTPYFATVLHDDPTSFFERELRSPETAPLFAAIAAAGVEVVLPFAELAGANCYNSAALIGADGGEIGRYRKMHIPGHSEPLPDGRLTFMEKRYFAPGDLGFPVYAARSARVGMLVCYDRQFPESYRCLALDGAEVIAIGYNSPLEPEEDASTARDVAGQVFAEDGALAMRAGARANGVHVIGAGKAGVEWGTRYIGDSLVIGPTGNVLAQAKGEGDQLVLAEIDLDFGRRVRERLNLGTNRRPEWYGTLGRAPARA